MRIDKIEYLCYNKGMGKHYELLKVENGVEWRRYDDGTIRNQNGQMLVLPEGLPAITSDNAHNYHRMRKEKILRAIEAKVMDVTKTNIPADAVGAIVAKRAAVAMNDDGKVGNDAARIVLQAIDAYQDKVEKSTVTRNEYAMDAETLAILRAMMDARNNSTDVLDVDAESMGENEE